MNRKQLTQILHDFKSGKTDERQVLSLLMQGPLNTSRHDGHFPDRHRLLRQGLAEVVYSESKKTKILMRIAHERQAETAPVLFTRLRKKQAHALRKAFPDGRANKIGRTFILNPPPLTGFDAAKPFVLITAAGSSDLPVAEEAAEVCIAMHIPFKKVIDVGVAGLHRVLHNLDVLQQATAIVVIAGMEGALPSVVGGLVDCPVFAVPTSVGYGASFKGISALLGMLNSCAPGVMVSNIDNGFSAAFAACQVVRQVQNGK